MSDLHIRKLCNALIPNAAPSGLVPGVVVDTVDRMSRKAGGLWVGGRVEITPDGVSFTANGLNRAFHTGLQPVHIPMTAIHKAWREFGWVTGIVAV